MLPGRLHERGPLAGRKARIEANGRGRAREGTVPPVVWNHLVPELPEALPHEGEQLLHGVGRGRVGAAEVLGYVLVLAVLEEVLAEDVGVPLARAREHALDGVHQLEVRVPVLRLARGGRAPARRGEARRPRPRGTLGR